MIQAFHSINGYIALAAAFINLVFAVLVIARTSRSTVYITFFFICLSIMFWNFCDFMVFITGKNLWPPAGTGSGTLWKELDPTGSSMAVAFMFHFINALIFKDKKNRIWIVLAYMVSLFFAISSPLAHVDPVIGEFVYSTTWNILFFLLLVPYLLWGIFLLLQAIHRAQSDDVKSRLRYVLCAALIIVFAGITDLVQKLEIPVPPLGHLGSVIGPSILALGVFKHRKAYDLLAQTQMKLEVLSETAAVIAHEIRNPLSSIKGAANLQADDLNGSDHQKIREYSDIIIEEIDRLNNILLDFQDFTRPLRLEKEPVSINELINKTVRLVEVGALDVKVKLELSKNLPAIRVDPTLMKQVFLNLIKNAQEACGTEGELVIETGAISPGVKIGFTDNGPGIPPEIVNRIFEPFFSTKRDGLGVGLALSKRIVEAHDGSIEANNVLPGGSQFSILLPV